MFKEFSEYLGEIDGVNYDFVEEFIAGCKYQIIPKGSFLLKEGGYLKDIFWVGKGLLVKYSIDTEGKKHVIQFAPENWWIAEREAVFLGNPSKYYIESIEETKVISFDEELVLKLHKKYPTFNKFHYRLLQNHIEHLTTRILFLLSLNAEEKYLQFIKIYPNLSLRVPLGMIASHLGIAQESLSRVRKELTHKRA